MTRQFFVFSIKSRWEFCHFNFLSPSNYDFFDQSYQNIDASSTRQVQGIFKMACELKINKLHNDTKKSYNCDQCGFSCNAPSKLKIHMRVHSGEKPFVCSQCNHSCKEASKLKVHMLTHSGEKPYDCKQCDFSCTQAGNLISCHSFSSMSLIK